MLIPTKPLHPETQRHVRRLGTTTNGQVRALDRLIRALHDEGIWDRLHTLNVAGLVSADTLLDLKGNQDSALVGAPVHVSGRGFTTVGVTAFIDTQFTYPSSEAKDRSHSVYIRQTPAGVYGATYMGERYLNSLSGWTYAFIGDATAGQNLSWMETSGVRTIGMTGGGFFAASIGSSDTHILVSDEVANSSPQTTLTGTGSKWPVSVGCRNSYGTYDNPAPNQYAHWSCGMSMSVSQMLAYDNLIKDYFTAWGTAV